MMKAIHYTLITLSCAAAVLLSGCVKIWQDNLDIKTYMVEAPRTGEPAEEVLADRLWIDTVHVLPPFNVRNLILRVSDVEFKTSYYTELLISPSENFRNAIYAWFAHSRLFEDVTIVERKGMSHHLTATVMEFYGDTAAMDAVLKIKITLFDERTRGIRVLFSKDYLQRIDIQEAAAGELISSYNQALIRILSEAEQDVIDTLR